MISFRHAVRHSAAGRVNRMNLAYFREIGTVWILSLVVGFGLGYLYRYCTAREVN